MAVIFGAIIGSGQIADGAVTTPKLYDQAVTTAKIADLNVTTAKIADGNITTPKILDSAITTAKILDANITTPKIADANVTFAKLAFTPAALGVYDNAGFTHSSNYTFKELIGSYTIPASKTNTDYIIAKINVKCSTIVGGQTTVFLDVGTAETAVTQTNPNDTFIVSCVAVGGVHYTKGSPVTLAIYDQSPSPTSNHTTQVFTVDAQAFYV